MVLPYTLHFSLVSHARVCRHQAFAHRVAPVVHAASVHGTGSGIGWLLRELVEVVGGVVSWIFCELDRLQETKFSFRESVGW